jgi:hypothetical protein
VNNCVASDIVNLQTQQASKGQQLCATSISNDMQVGSSRDLRARWSNGRTDASQLILVSDAMGTVKSLG